MLQYQRNQKKLSNIKVFFFVFFVVYGVPACHHKQHDKIEVVKLLKVPPQMADVSYIRVGKMMVRQSPSASSKVEDFFVKKYDNVIIQEKYKDWAKVFILENRSSGWLPSRALAKPQPNHKSFIIPYDGLKKVHVISKIENIEFEDAKSVSKIRVISKGSPAYVLKIKKEKVLTWLPFIRKLAWLPRDQLDI